MKTKQRLWLIAMVAAGTLAALAWYLHGRNIPVLQPRGITGDKERHLINISLLLSALVVIPVFTMTAVISFKYREGNESAKYRPDWDHSRFFETIWWGIPFVIIGILSVITWNSAHALDPYKPLNSAVKPMTIQVVSLDWKWLFIYPQQGIASVNFVQLPIDTPINFHVTSDSVMNSFWIPQLGGQIYAMPGMDTQINLMATSAGDFAGSSANISGRGFAGMNFTVKASSNTKFDDWVSQTQAAGNNLTRAEYDRLAKPSQNTPPAVYSATAAGLYDDIVLKYMLPPSQLPSGSSLQPYMNGAAM